MEIINEKQKVIYEKLILLIKKNKIDEVKLILSKLEKYKKEDDDIRIILDDIKQKLDLLNRYIIQWDSIYLYIINLCDYKCIFCDRSEKELREMKENKYTDIWDIEFIIWLFEFNWTLNKYKFFEIWWHEPLANKNILEIIKYLSNFWKKFIIHTSWSQPEVLLKLIENWTKIERVQIPIYSLNKNTFNTITNNNNAYDNYEQCTKILINKNIKYASETILVRNNLEEIELFKTHHYWLLMPNNINVFNLYKLNWIKFFEYATLFWNLNKNSYIKYFDNSHYIKLPFCVLYKISKDYYNEIFHNISSTSESNNIKPNEYSNMKKIQEENREYIKPNKCGKCKAYGHCQWYYKVHFDVFWDNEVEPILD